MTVTTGGRGARPAEESVPFALATAGRLAAGTRAGLGTAGMTGAAAGVRADGAAGAAPVLRGVVAVPPPAPDPLLGVGIGVALAGVIGIALFALERRRGTK